MNRIVRTVVTVVVGFPLLSLAFLFPGGTGPRTDAARPKLWEEPPPS